MKKMDSNLLPKIKEAWMNNEVAEAESLLLQCDMNNPTIQYLLGELYLYMGNYSRGWSLWESRNFLANYKDKHDKPRWDGNQERVIIKFEQGLGDAIQFSRYIPLLKQLIPCLIIEVPLNMFIAWKDFTLEVPSLKKLFSVFEDDNTLVVPYDFHKEEYDAWFPLLSAPILFRTTLQNIPEPINLNPRKPYWKFKPNEYEQEITIGWKGSPTNPNDINRSLSKESVLNLIKKKPQFLWHNVHPTEAIDLPNVINHGPDITDITDVADICQRSDRVISVDTSIAHLAATCGCPTELLISWSCDWRWGLTGKTTPWYPTINLNRQKTPGDWDSAIEQISTI